MRFAKRNEATRLLRSGMYLDDIAQEMGVSFQTIVRYLKLQVAEGALKVSDVFFGLRPSRRDRLERLLAQTGGRDTKQYYRAATDEGFSWDEANIYWSLRANRISSGDMYEYIADLEIDLHRFVRLVLEQRFGASENGWWRQGVPLGVRKSCVQAKEEDPDPVADPYAYTTFINLAETIDKNWPLFTAQLPNEWASNKKAVTSNLTRVNHIRNAVMHPVKDKRWDEGDFAFVRGMVAQLRYLAGGGTTPNKALQQTVRFAPRS